MSQPTMQQPLQIWTFLSGATDLYKNIAIPNKGTIPLYAQVQTTDAIPVNITITEVAADKRFLTLSSALYDQSKIRVGMYVYVDAQVNKRKIIALHGPTTIEVDYPFPSAVTAQNLLVVEKSLYRYLRVESVGSVDSPKVDGVVIKTASIPIEIDFPECITYDASTASQSLRFTLGQ